MKSTGIVRRVDELGRLVIPKEMRKKMNIADNDPVEIFVDGEKIIITKYTPFCTFCQSNENVTEFKGRNVCRACLEEMRSLSDNA